VPSASTEQAIELWKRSSQRLGIGTADDFRGQLRRSLGPPVLKAIRYPGGEAAPAIACRGIPWRDAFNLLSPCG
jgi:hypothetical protein